jgi:poly(hydroxyalkanoate) granule-associated protein
MTMVRKTKQAGNPDQNALVDAVFTSAQQIWVAGLGAFVRAQNEGSELFDRLVQEGGDLAKLTERFAPDTPLPGGRAMSRLAENMGKQASGSWDKLEKIFEERVARAMRGLGMPSHDDIEALSQQLADIRQKLAALEAGASKPAPRKAAAKTAAKPPGKQAVKLAAKGAAIKSGARAAAKRTARVTSH